LAAFIGIAQSSVPNKSPYIITKTNMHTKLACCRTFQNRAKKKLKNGKNKF